MSSAKTERLVNLTMALLGSKRFMSKSEIFRRVAGYSGSQETKERMFERDKDDLRTLGIDIEVASHDPFFEDEVGYRIRPEIFQIHEEFESTELGLISLALGLLNNEDFSETAKLLNLRLNSLSVTPEMPDAIPAPEIPLSESGLAEILKALSERTTISFSYRKGEEVKAEVRRVNPLGVSAWRGGWYLVAEDLDRDDIRSFKLSRIESAIAKASKPEAYEIPKDFDIKDYLVMLKPWEYETKLRLRKTAGMNIRNRASLRTELDDEWESIKVNFADETHALRECLWLGDDVEVVAPEPLRDSVIKHLERLATLHG